MHTCNLNAAFGSVGRVWQCSVVGLDWEGDANDNKLRFLVLMHAVRSQQHTVDLRTPALNPTSFAEAPIGASCSCLPTEQPRPNFEHHDGKSWDV